MKKYKLAIFDMDGTILDTLDDLHDSLNYALQKNGYPEHSLAEVRSFVGNGIRKLVERGVPLETSYEKLQKVLDDFTSYYVVHCFDKTKPYNEILFLLHQLKNSGYKIACVSNKDDYAVKKLTTKFFEGLFDISVGSSENVRKKPAPDTVNTVLKLLCVNHNEAVYIGDSEVDIETAKNAKMDCICVTWGFRDKNELIKNGSKVLVDNPLQILELIL